LKRAGIIAVALLAAYGLLAAAAHPKAKRVTTEAELEGFRTTTPGEYEFFGDVHSLKTKCERGRDVTLVFTGTPGVIDPVGTDTTDRTGDWEIDAVAVVPSGPYLVEVERKRVRRAGKRLVCKQTVSEEQSLDSEKM
jgi:hypothetical protein